MMKSISNFLRKLITSPIGIGVSITHWIVVLFALYGETHQPSLFYFHFTNEPLLTQWLYVLNLPALMVSGVIIAPAMAVWGQSTTTIILAAFIWILLITLQWLVIGYILSKIFNSPKSNETKLSVFNE